MGGRGIGGGGGGEADAPVPGSGAQSVGCGLVPVRKERCWMRGGWRQGWWCGVLGMLAAQDTKSWWCFGGVGGGRTHKRSRFVWNQIHMGNSRSLKRKPNTMHIMRGSAAVLLLLAACATHRADAADPFTCVSVVRPFPPVPTTHPIFIYFLVARLRSGTNLYTTTRTDQNRRTCPTTCAGRVRGPRACVRAGAAVGRACAVLPAAGLVLQGGARVTAPVRVRM